MHLALWIILGIIGIVIYVNIGYYTYRFLIKNEPITGDETLLGAIWPFFWLTIVPVSCVCYGISLGFKKVVVARFWNFLLFYKLPDYYKAWRERRRAKKAAKLLETHQADPLQGELNRYQELRHLIPEKERELVALKQERDVLEAQREGSYRELAVVSQTSRVALPEVDVEMDDVGVVVETMDSGRCDTFGALLPAFEKESVGAPSGAEPVTLQDAEKAIHDLPTLAQRIAEGPPIIGRSGR